MTEQRCEKRLLRLVAKLSSLNKVAPSDMIFKAPPISQQEQERRCKDAEKRKEQSDRQRKLAKLSKKRNRKR